ncbi:GHKL domain-containing protein [Clostridium sp.]|uniref:sensor histidine kinase n=1 Tax=Clostridium sp. TaxID=1506 RepID=UPI002844E5F1|nr:GHKL domain-containing protein [Clostridium sp.]MDR3595863.1 GHKL domain-containing protein [Clostridium sp.]
MNAFSLIYLLATLSKWDKSIVKLILTVLTLASVSTIMDYLDINFIFLYIVSIVVIKIAYKKDFKDIIFGFFLILFMILILELIIDLCIIRFVNDYEIQGVIIESIIMIGTIIFSKVKVMSKQVVLKYVRFKKENGGILNYFIWILGIYVVFLKFLWNYDNKIIQDNLLITIGIISILIICHVFTYLYVVRTIREKEELKISNEYSSAIEEIVQEIKQRQHDFINYKNTIKGIVNVVDKKDVKEAISNYIEEDVYDNKINSLIYIENVVIRSIIYRNMCKFKKYNIDFEYEIENNVLDDILSYTEISNVLSNLLNNAFEEVVKEECINKNIEVKIFSENKTSHLIIKNQILNPNKINLNEMFTRGYSTKNSGTRGYGLYNVQAIVNSHKGNIKISVVCGEIIFDIYFNNSSG